MGHTGFLAAFADLRDGILRPEARTILAVAPTPDAAAKLTRTRLHALLTKAGRRRSIDTHANRLHRAFATVQLRQLPLVEQAMGPQTVALLRQLEAACASADDLAAATAESFAHHPDADIITSFPGLSQLTEPACWPNSVTTAPASPTPARSRPTPAPLRSPEPPARASPFSTAE